LERAEAVSNDGKANESAYIETARSAAENFRVKETMAQFVKDHGLEGKKVLDVGSGKGSLQDLITGYTGLDIVPVSKQGPP
jgi:2-polyprenyl-3-methyl-5-hydroxy-6-metoxy-1,4-benzoquinol methylase